MSRPKSKEEYRAELANVFIDALSENGLDWKKGWRGACLAPQNGITKACYRGSNAFYLGLVSLVNGYTDPRWVTMVQIIDKDKKYHPKEKWHLKKGSKASYVEYWYPYDLKEKKALKWDEYHDLIKSGRNKDEFKLSTRYTAVFNAENVEGMPQLKIDEVNNDIKPSELVDKLSLNMGVPIHFDGGDKAYYSPKKDSIHLPKRSCFNSDYDFSSTALHELAHATGHMDRLDRKQGQFFGSPEYAYEELVAEITSCYMGISPGNEIPKEHLENHKAYVSSWITGIKEKPEVLIKALKDAENAANYMEWKAELLTDKEYISLRGKSFEMQVKEERNVGKER